MTVTLKTATHSFPWHCLTMMHHHTMFGYKRFSRYFLDKAQTDRFLNYPPNLLQGYYPPNLLQAWGGGGGRWGEDCKYTNKSTKEFPPSPPQAISVLESDMLTLRQQWASERDRKTADGLDFRGQGQTLSSHITHPLDCPLALFSLNLISRRSLTPQAVIASVRSWSVVHCSNRTCKFQVRLYCSIALVFVLG